MGRRSRGSIRRILHPQLNGRIRCGGLTVQGHCRRVLVVPRRRVHGQILQSFLIAFLRWVRTNRTMSSNMFQHYIILLGRRRRRRQSHRTRARMMRFQERSRVHWHSGRVRHRHRHWHRHRHGHRHDRLRLRSKMGLVVILSKKRLVRHCNIRKRSIVTTMVAHNGASRIRGNKGGTIRSSSTPSGNRRSRSSTSTSTLSLLATTHFACSVNDPPKDTKHDNQGRKNHC